MVSRNMITGPGLPSSRTTGTEARPLPAAGRGTGRTGPYPLAVFVLGLAVYGWGVGAVSPWRDEGATLAVCRRGVGEIVSVARTVDLVHLAYYLLAHVALAVHDSVTSARLISVVAMAAAAALLVSIGQRMGDPTTGLLAGLLLVASPLASRWAQEARPFALVTAVAVASTLALLLALDPRTPSSRAWWWYGATLVLLGVLNVLALMLVAVHAVHVLVAGPRRARLGWLVAAAGGLCVVAPFVGLAFRQRGQVSWITVPHLTDLAAPFATAVGSTSLLLLVSVLSLAACALAWWRRGRLTVAARATVVLGAAWAVVPPVLLWTVSQVHPLWDAHYVLFALPGLSLGLAWVLRILAGAGQDVTRGRDTHAVGAEPASGTGPAAKRGRRARGWVVAGVTVALCLAGLPAQAANRDPASGHDEDLRGVADYLGEHAQLGDAVLYVPYKLRVIGTVYPGRTRVPADVALARSPVESATIHGVDVTAAELPDRLRGFRRVWLVHGPYPVREEVDLVKTDLPRLGYRSQQDADFAGFTVTLYRLDQA